MTHGELGHSRETLGVDSVDSVDGVDICLDIYPQDYLDPVLSLVIVVIICVSAWPLLRDSTLVLLNTIPPHIDLGRLQAELVTTVPGVSSIHELHVWRLVGRSGRCCSCSVTV